MRVILEEYFHRWADPYPRTIDDLEQGAGAPNEQQRLVAGVDHFGAALPTGK